MPIGRGLRIAAGVILTACTAAAAAQGVTLEQALEKVRLALASIPYVRHADLIGDESGARYRAARDFIREQQCLARTANPLLALPASLGVRGTLVPSQTPPVAETFELPFRIASLADLPNEYLKDADGVDQRQNHQLLDARVKSLVASFDQSKCRRGGDDRASTPRSRPVFVAPTF